MKVIPAKITDKTKFSENVKKIFLQLQKDQKSAVSKSNQLSKSESSKAVNGFTSIVPKNKFVPKVVQKDLISKRSDLSDSSISESCTLNRIAKEKGKFVKECNLGNHFKSSSLSRNKSINKKSVTDTNSDVTKPVNNVTLKTCYVKTLHFNQKCDCFSCSKLLASKFHSFTIPAHKLINFSNCAKGLVFKWIPKSDLCIDTNSKGPISKWVPKSL